MTSRFTPALTGGWLALVREGRLLAVAPRDDAFADAAWGALEGSGSVQSVLDVLTANGLAATPHFALVESVDGIARVIVRGDVDVSVARADGVEKLTGVGVATWVERTIDEVVGVEVSVPGATAGEWRLPLVAGAAIVSSVRVGDTASVSAAPSASSAPADESPAAVAAALAQDAQPPAPHEATPSIAAEAPATSVPPTSTPPTVASVEVPAALAVPPKQAKPADPFVTVVGLPDEVQNRHDAPPAAQETSAEPTATGESTLAADEDGYDYLFGDTMYRSVADAAVHEADPEDADAAAPAATAEQSVEQAGDHDGHTIMTSDLPKGRGNRRNRLSPAVLDTAPELVLVVSPTGAREVITGTVLVGRSPSVSKVPGTELPKLITIGGDQDLSRNHAQITLSGGTVVVTDLHSKNGTSVQLPGKPAQKLRAGDPTTILVGTVIDFGGDITLTLEEA